MTNVIFLVLETPKFSIKNGELRYKATIISIVWTTSFTIYFCLEGGSTGMPLPALAAGGFTMADGSN